MTVSIKKVNEIAHQEPGRAAQLARVRKEMKIKMLWISAETEAQGRT